jgi:hypothetical protein
VAHMRFRELNEVPLWKKYQTRTHPVIIASPSDLGNGKCIVTEAECQYGEVFTGKTEVFWGYFVRVINPFGEEWLGEDRHSLRRALTQASEAAEHSGWSLIALGCTPEFQETGLSENSGYGYHTAHPDRAVHMLEPIPRQREAHDD